MRTPAWTLGMLLALAAPSAAFAAEPSAEALYQEGRRAIAANDLELACRKFAESQAHESAPGTLLNLGDCEERRGHLVLARDSFKKAVAGFQANDARLAYARDRLAQVEKRVARLTVRAPTIPAGSQLMVTVDGMAAALNAPVWLERGPHVVTMREPGAPDTTIRVDLVEGEVRNVDLKSNQAPASQPASSSSSEAAVTPTRSATVNVAMWGSFGLAAAGLLVGTYAGIRTLDAKNVTDDNCKGGCNSVGLAAQDEGRTWGPTSTVGFIVGGVALAAAVTLLVFGKSAPKAAHALVAPRSSPTFRSFELAF